MYSSSHNAQTTPLPCSVCLVAAPEERENILLWESVTQARKSTSLRTPFLQAPLLLSSSLLRWVTALYFMNWLCLLTRGKEDQLIPFPPGAFFPTSHLAPLWTNTGTTYIITRLRRSLCSTAWSSSFPSIFTDRGLCRAFLSHILSQLLLCNVSESQRHHQYH